MAEIKLRRRRWRLARFLAIWRNARAHGLVLPLGLVWGLSRWVD